MNIREVLKDALTFFDLNFRRIMSLLVPLFVIEVVLTFIPIATVKIVDIITFADAVSLAFTPLYTALIISFMHSRLHEKELDYKELFNTAFTLWKPYFIYMIILYIFMVLVMALVIWENALFILLLLLVWLIARFSLTHVLIMEKGFSVTKAMDTSFVMTKGHAWRLSLLSVSVLIPVLMLFILFRNNLNEALVGYFLTFFIVVSTTMMHIAYYRYYIFLFTTQHRS